MPMKSVAVFLVVALAAAPAFAADEQPGSASVPIHRAQFWSGLALAVAGVATSVAGVTFARVEDSSTGNAPVGTYQSCVAQRSDPIYATNDCNGLKGTNGPLLWGGVALGAVGAVLMVGSTRTSAQIGPHSFRLIHTIRF
jgi:hypothetical protein